MEKGQNSKRNASSKKKAPVAHMPLAKAERNFATKGKYSFANFLWKCDFKGISIERVFDEELMNYINFKFMNLLKSWGWWDLIVNPTYKPRVEMVKVFYWNGSTMYFDEEFNEFREWEDKFSTSVCGVKFTVSVDDIREILGKNIVKGNEVSMPKNNDRMTDSLAVREYCKEVPQMNVHKSILFMMISQALLVRNDRFHEVSDEDLWWMGKIVREDPPDLCAAIFLKMRNSLEHAHNKADKSVTMDDICLPYGKLVTRIIEKKLNYNINRREPFTTRSWDEEKPFDLEAFSLMFPNYNPLLPPPPPHN